VQDNHVHLIVEASDKDALSRGMKSFTVRANRLFNVAWGRKRGQVWGDRYHRRDLTSPRSVRNALVYCLNTTASTRPARARSLSSTIALPAHGSKDGWKRR